MRYKTTWSWAFLVGASWMAGASVLGAEEKGGLSPGERRTLLLPLYEQVKNDPKLRALEPGRLGRMNDPATVEAFLRAMPISPREYLQIDMHQRRYEVIVPRFLQLWHQQWIGYHEDEARRLYGEGAREPRLLDQETPAEGQEASRVAIGVLGGVNRNAAATSAPPPDEFQGEIQIAANPRDPTQIVAAANTWDDVGGACGGDTQAVFSSNDGGTTWAYTCAPGAASYAALPACGGTVFGSDPALSWNDNNEVFLNYMLLCNVGFSIDFALVVARSTDGGATWAARGVVKNSWNTADVEDKNFYAIDIEPSSPYYGRHYVCWDRNNNEKLAYSTNSGTTWTEVDLPAGGGLDLGCDVTVQKNGKVHVIFDTLTCAGANCTNERLFYTKSTNGGVAWTAPLQLRDYNLTGFSGTNCPDAQDDRCIGPLGAIDVDRSGGPCNDNLFVTYADYDVGGTIEDTDVWVVRSTNNGVTWSAPVRVNDAGTGLSGVLQFNPTLAVDQYDGEVVVAWQDARNDVNNKNVETFLATSTTCGLSFGGNIQVANGGGAAAEFNNNATSYSNENSLDNPNGNPNQFGEYMGLDVQGSTAFLAWMDTRHFYPAFTTDVQKENLAFELNTLVKTPKVLTAYSVGADDGRVTEATEVSNTGGSFSATTTTPSGVWVGDTATDQERRGFLSFTTLDIPAEVTILSARLRVRRGNLVGTSPFATHGGLFADVQTAGFGGNLALELADWQASATASNACALSEPLANGDWAECFLDAAGLAAIHTNGRTQIRLHFALGDNDDASDDYMGFYPGDAIDPANRPQLIVTYQ